MPKLLAILLLLFFFRLISTKTSQKDVNDLQEILQLVLDSSLSLKGWQENSEPCVDNVSCGINDLPECAWEGIACFTKNNHSRVVAIEIKGGPRHKLEGFLPRKLPSALKSLSLPDNRLKGNLTDPNCSETDSKCEDLWSRNTRLTTVNLDGNEITGTLPNWKKLSRLETLSIARNRLVGPLPQQWKGKIHFETLNLASNFLTGSLPVEWSELKVLETLNLSSNELTDEIPSAWFFLPRLDELDVSGNCGICGNVEREPRFTFDGDGTNLKTDCSKCNGCKCRRGTLKFVVTNVLLSLSVLVLSLFAWLLRQWCKRNETQQLPVQTPVAPMPNKSFDPLTIVVSPGEEVFFAKVLEEGPLTSTSWESVTSKASSSKSSSSSRDPTEEESSDYQSESDSDSVDSRVLAFMHNSSPIIRMSAYRTRSIGNAGTREAIDENSGSGSGTNPTFVNTELRRSKSALEGTSKRSLTPKEQSSTADTGAGPSSSSGQQTNDASTSQISHKKSKKRFRNFKRKSRRGLVGDFKISEPQPSIALPEDFNAVLASLQSPESKAIQTSGSLTNKK